MHPTIAEEFYRLLRGQVTGDRLQRTNAQSFPFLGAGGRPLVRSGSDDNQGKVG